MRYSNINDRDNVIRFFSTFCNEDKIAHENLISPFEIQKLINGRSNISLDEVLQLYRENGFEIDLPPSGSKYEDFQYYWSSIRGKSNGHYFRYRCTTESYLSGIHLLKLAQGHSLVDIGCGSGHFSAVYKFYCKSTTAVDAELSNLLILNCCFSPSTSLICTDLNVTIGLDGRRFDSVFISDVLHYIKDKERFLSEVHDSWNCKGYLLLNHIHHLGQKVYEAGMGVPLHLSEWKDLIQREFPHAIIKFYSESAFIKYVIGDSSTLEQANDTEESPVLCIVSHHSFDLKQKIPVPPCIQLNTAYSLCSNEGQIVLTRKNLPQSFLDEFESDLFPKQYVLPNLLFPVDALFARGLFFVI